MSNDDDHSHRMAALRAEFPILTVGLECGRGWNGIIREWLAEVTAIVNAHPQANFRIKQIKEKMSGIRLYTETSGDIALPVRRATHLAEARALRTCEICGASGHPVNDFGWYRVTCREHADEALLMPASQELNPLGDGMGGSWRYDPDLDDLVHEPGRTVAELYEYAADISGELILYAVIGPWLTVNGDGWPRWGERVPADKRNIVLPWAQARLLLDYKPVLEQGDIKPALNPVVAWTGKRILQAEVHYYHVEIHSVPTSPTAFEPRFR